MEKMLLTFVIGFTIVAFISAVHSDYVPTRKTLHGHVRGQITSRVPGRNIEEYLGVPYASPPVGDLRFKPPVDPVTWEPDILETNIISPCCPTHNLIYIQLHKEGFNRTNEDCLYLNIYVPQVDTNKLPVLLFIHGGDNADGMGAMFDGDVLAAYGEIIVVTINYRISVLGFFADRDNGIDGNYGLLDQVKAMQWVRDNIHFFNGDPSKVTLHGHSAGAADVGLHLVSDMSKGLFRYAIVHSGSPLAYWHMSDCVQISRLSSIPRDCKEGTSRTTKKVRKKIEELINYGSIKDFMSSIALGEDAFRVVIDGTFVTNSPEHLLSCRPVHADSVLVVMARDEGFEPRIEEVEKFYKNKTVEDVIKKHKHLFPGRTDFEADVRQAYKDWILNNMSSYPHDLHMTADVGFFAPMIKLADMISKWMSNIYVLSFEYVSQDIPGPDWIGIQHGWDLFYIFGMPLVGHHSHQYYAERDKEVSKKTMIWFSNYVKYGYISMNDTENLTPYNSTLKSYNKLDFDNEHTVVTHEINFRGPRMDFWYNYLFPYDTGLTCSANMNSVISISLIITCNIVICLAVT